jgi:hypothetical protein
MMIDCDACAVRGPACADCVVSVLLGAPPAHRPGAGDDSGPDPGIDLDGHEQAAIAVLAGSGLVPPLRLVPMDRSLDVARPIQGGDVTRPGGRRSEDDQDGRPGSGGREAV